MSYDLDYDKYWGKTPAERDEIHRATIAAIDAEYAEKRRAIVSESRKRQEDITSTYRDNIRKIDEESAKVQRENDTSIHRAKLWIYVWAAVAVCWGLVLASGGLFNR